MRNRYQGLTMLAAAFLVAGYLGCKGEGTPEKTAAKSPAPGSSDAATPVPEKRGTKEPAPTPTMPVPILDETLLANCRVKVGDPMPDAKLGLPGDGEQSLRELCRGKLAVVFFWNSGSMSALKELQDLGPDVAQPYAQQEVLVVGINHGDEPEVVQQWVETTQAAFPVLLDQSGTLFPQLNTGKVPCTYLLDPEGKILWFEPGYDLSMQRTLKRAIEFTLDKRSKQEAGTSPPDG